MDSIFVVKDKSLLARLLVRSGIDTEIDHGDRLLEKLCATFSGIPYENLTKIIRSDAVITPGSAKRFPDEVIWDYLEYGAGGTCFSLTAAFVAILDALGITAYPILADRHYGTDTHCALLFLKDSDLFLLDPGFLIHQPVRLPTTEPEIISRGFNTIELVPLEAGRKIDLVTVTGGSRRNRLTYRLSPVDAETFCLAWDRSFTWEMMRYPVLTRYQNGVHLYLQGDVLRIRNGEGTIKRYLSAEDQYEFITRKLGVDRGIVHRALSVLM